MPPYGPPHSLPRKDEAVRASAGSRLWRFLRIVGPSAPLAAAFAGLVVATPRVAAEPATARFAVATESRAATLAAAAILRAGGNATDAAVTAALVAGVASPSSSGIGGGGFAIVWDAANKKATCLDFREVAPAGIDVDAFERRPLSTAERGKLVGVPGEVAGLAELHRRFGKKRWSEVVLPAARVATDGYPVSEHLASTVLGLGAKLSVDPLLAALFRPEGNPVGSGVSLKNPRLAGTLRRIAAGGPTALYQGPLAADLASAAKAAGGALGPDDLASYRPVERAPLHVTWEGLDVFTMPPPSAGGLMLAETLGMLTSAELKKLGRESGAYHHLVGEVLRGALSDRMRFVGDPDHEPVDVARLLGKERLAARRKSIALDRTHAPARFGTEEHGTHHLVTADAAGNVVSLTTTVNRAFGALITAPSSGVVLNDELDDFTTKVAVRPFGLGQSPNRPRPGARPVSSMTPTIVVRQGIPVLAAGGSGGMTIGPNVTQVILAHLVFGLPPDQAVTVARFTVPTEGSYIALDPKAPPELRADLERRGEIVSLQRSTANAVQMLVFDGNRYTAAADPRKSGTALTQ